MLKKFQPVLIRKKTTIQVNCGSSLFTTSVYMVWSVLSSSGCSNYYSSKRGSQVSQVHTGRRLVMGTADRVNPKVNKHSLIDFIYVTIIQLRTYCTWAHH